MLEWLQTILEGAKIEDGKLDVTAVMNAVKSEFPKNAVPKTEFNDKVKELKAAEGTIAELKKNAGDNTELTEKIKKYALKAKLTEAGALDSDYLIYKQGGLDKFNFDKDGNPVGIDDVLKPLRESLPHLFKTESKPNGYNPAGGSGSGSIVNPWKKESFNMTEQGKILRNDPVQAKQLASAAGITLNI